MPIQPSRISATCASPICCKYDTIHRQVKFLYEYKTRENERREGEILAPSLDAVYKELKKQGIRPSKVTLAPGLFNKMQSIGKRGLAIGLLVLAVIGIAVLLVMSRDEAEAYRDRAEVFRDKAEAFSDRFENKTRRQVIGDTAVIEKGIRTGWSEIFAEEGERFLASFAIPGVPAGQRNTTEEEIRAALSRKVETVDGDGIEARQIKAMVEGMKDELREYLRDGGTIKEYGACLVERQETELGYYNRTKSELETLKASGMSVTELEAIWEKRNSELRQMGIKLVPLPER